MNHEKLEEVLGASTAISFNPDGTIGVHIPESAKGTATESIAVQMIEQLIQADFLSSESPTEGNA